MEEVGSGSPRTVRLALALLAVPSLNTRVRLFHDVPTVVHLLPGYPQNSIHIEDTISGETFLYRGMYWTDNQVTILFLPHERCGLFLKEIMLCVFQSN